MNNLLKRTLSGAAFVVVTVAAILGGSIFILPLFFFFAMATQWEFYRLVWKPEHRDRKFISIGLVAGGLLYIAACFYALSEASRLSYILAYPADGITSLLSTRGWYRLAKGSFFLSFFFLFFYCGWQILYSKRNTSFADWGKLVMGFFYVAIPFACAAFFGIGRPWLLLVALIFTWINDTAAYGVGSLLGKHKLIPSVSPGKTVEGFIGGLVFTTLFGALLPFIAPRNFFWSLDWSITASIGLLVAVVAVVGDLVESRLKRSLGVKDSGVFLPGHGGFLDRFDSLLFVFPMMFILSYVISFLDRYIIQ